MENNELIKKRLMDLADKAYKNNCYTYTNFLNLSELDTLYQIRKEIDFICHQSFGGNPMCERQIVCFGSEKELGYSPSYPIVLITIRPLIEKFADSFTHRDFLGAIINLGIERNTLGDIFIKNNIGYLFCHTKIADYILENLQKVKHTHVKCLVGEMDFSDLEPVYEEIKLSVASERIDAVVAGILNLSRSKTIELFRSRKIFVNSHLVENNDFKLDCNAIISVRGYGKFIYEGIITVTKKNKYLIIVKKLV